MNRHRRYGLWFAGGSPTPPPPDSFLDTFDHADGDLAVVNPDWTRISGVSGSGYIASGALRSLGNSTATVYEAPLFEGDGIYVEAKFATGSQGASVVLRVESATNFIGLNYNGSGLTTWKYVNGTYTQLGTYAIAYTAGDTIRIEIDADNQISVYLNGQKHAVSGTEDASSTGFTSNQCGVRAGGPTDIAFLTSFKTGTLS